MTESGATNRRARGFTLIELTVVLAVIVTLALVLTPSIANFINDSRVGEGAQRLPDAVASAIFQFYRDTGFFPLWKVAQNGGPGLPANRLQVLASRGNPPLEDVPTLWSTGATGGLAEQLVNNAPGYTLKTPPPSSAGTGRISPPTSGRTPGATATWSTSA